MKKLIITTTLAVISSISFAQVENYIRQHKCINRKPTESQFQKTQIKVYTNWNPFENLKTHTVNKTKRNYNYLDKPSSLCFIKCDSNSINISLHY